VNCNEIIFSKKILLKEGTQYKVFPGSIEITGNEITNVSKLTLESYQGSIQNEKHINKIKIHDFGDRLITPAFINCHTHIAMNFFRSILSNHLKPQNLIEDIFFKAESLLGASDIRAFSRLGAYENILNGNGLIWDHYYHGLEVAEACREVGLTAVIAPTLQDISGPGVPYYKSMLEETHYIHSNSSLKNASIYAAFGPHATDTVSEALWKEIKNDSKKLNIPIHCHVSQSYEEVITIYKKHKKTPVQFLDSLGITRNPSSTLLVHGIYLNKKDYQYLHGKNNALVFCPFSQMVFQSPANIIDWELNKSKWFIATDCVASNDSMNLQKELRLVAGFPSFLSTFGKNPKVIEKITQKNRNEFLSERKFVKKIQSKFTNSNFLLDKILEGPGSFHNHFKAGAIKIGSLANFIIWDLNHPSMWPGDNVTRNLTMGDTTGAIYNMCIAGKWLGLNGNFCYSILKSDNYKFALDEANERLKRLLKKL
jgi:5-methylthioadenosine/S-adenosylhomocysteine deaminase